MVSRSGRLGLGALWPALLLLPSAAPAQCQHMGPSQPAGGASSQTFQMSQTGMTRFQMPQMGMCRFSMPHMSTMQTQQIQMLALQQIQMVAMQQMQVVAMQQHMLTMQQLIALRPQQTSLVQQPPPSPQPILTALTPPQQKQYGELLREMTALQQRLDALEREAQQGALQGRQASDAQHEVNAMQGRVDALPKPPAAVLERMGALREQSDNLLQQASAKPADIFALVRGAH